MSSTPRYWNRALAKYLRPPSTAITERKVGRRCKSDKSFIDRSGVKHEVGYGVDGQRICEGFFNVNEIIGSQYDIKKKVLYLIK